tara:strand:- start:4100 stop:6010 length:1911 start_codon:yes stop_codon:yes gene_type:complete
MKNITIFLLFFGILNAQVSLSDVKKLGNKQLDELREELLQSNSDTQNLQDNLKESTNNTKPVNILVEETNNPLEEYFGYDYFKADINFFDNIPTPSDFKLGPGDEIILSLWGEKNSREKLVISKDGLIYYENIGFINLSNKTIQEAESLLVSELSTIYSTLKDSPNSTKLMIELGKSKSINVYFSGGVSQPGIKLIHPFSDIFVALVQAGGVNKEGSLRNIQLIRNGKVINTVDFYTFFSQGSNNFSSMRLIDGDIIHVPAVKDRIEIEGSVVRPGYYEVLDNDTLDNIISYAAGLEAQASSNVIIDQVIPMERRSSSNNGLSSINVNLNDSQDIRFNNGDVIFVQKMGKTSSKVEILGRVKNPGQYSAFNSSLKDILDIAGGFDDPIFRKTIRDDSILIIRKDENQFYGSEFKVPYESADSFELQVDDKIFVYEDSNYDNLFSIAVSGEVKKRGNFQLKKGTTVRDAIALAEGFTELANEDAVTVTEVFSSLDDEGNEVEESNQVNDASLDFELTNNSVVNVLPMENVVSVQGNVYDPGLIVYSGRKSLKKYINLAGGPKPNTLTSNIYIKRANGRTKKVSLFGGLGITVKPGDTIFVPVDPDPQDFDITTFIADLASTLANIAAILIIVDNQSD